MSFEYQLTAKKKKLCHIIFHAKKDNDNQGPLHKYNSLNLTLIKHFPIALLFVACIL